MIVELVFLTLIAVAGTVTLRASGLTGWGAVPLGFVAGLGIYIAVGTMQVLLNLPAHPIITLTATCVGALAWWWFRRRQGRSAALEYRSFGALIVTVLLVVPISRVTNLVTWHSDSFTYLMAGALIADGNYDVATDRYLVLKRPIGLPLLHAPAQLSEEIYLQSLGPLIALATLAALVWFFRTGTSHTVIPRAAALLAVLGVLALLSTNRFIFHAFYINGHLLTGLLIMVVAGAGWLLTQRPHQSPEAMMTVQLIAIIPLILIRPEGMAYAALALVPTILAREVPRWHRMALVVTWFAVTGGWHAYAAMVISTRDQTDIVSQSTLQIGILIAVAITGLMLPLLWRLLSAPIVTSHPRRWRAGAEAGLWLVFIGLAVVSSELMGRSLSATFENTIWPASTWGTMVVITGALVVAILAVWRVSDLASLRFALTTTLPLVFVMAVGRGGAYRVADYDSLNRMVIQWLPLAILFIIVAVATGSERTRRVRAVDTSSDKESIS